MKRLFALIVCLTLLLPAVAFGVESVAITTTSIIPKYIEQVTFTCTTDGAGALTNTPFSQQVLAKVSGMYLYCVTAYPTPGGTAPDAADVFILNQNSEDLLGSADNSTAGNGANLIHATLTRTTLPRLYLPGVNFYPVISGPLTLQIANQGTGDAQFTVVLTFVK